MGKKTKCCLPYSDFPRSCGVMVNVYSNHIHLLEPSVLFLRICINSEARVFTS